MLIDIRDGAIGFRNAQIGGHGARGARGGQERSNKNEGFTHKGLLSVFQRIYYRSAFVACFP